VQPAGLAWSIFFGTFWAHGRAIVAGFMHQLLKKQTALLGKTKIPFAL